jgi:hypothetical protein
MGALQ